MKGISTINLWKSKTYWILSAGALLSYPIFLLTKRCWQNNKPPISSRKAPPAFITGKANQKRLLASFPLEQRKRIEQLLKRQFNVCPPYPESMPSPIHKGFRIDVSRFFAEVNCYGTAGYVLTGKKYLFLIELDPMLWEIGKIGYKKVNTITVFKENKGELKRIDINKTSFNPGDLLIFEQDAFTENGQFLKYHKFHAAIYLGKINGVHYVFQKRYLFCGPKSPYEIISLDYMLSPIREDPPPPQITADRIHIYRR